MKTPHPLPSPSRTSPAAIASARNAGFALVITLSLMVLLMLLALGMLSLSSVSLRTSAQSADMNLARANARMALLLALGELQSHAGSDTRVTARADILDEENPPVTGVWKSWEGTDHETTGKFAGRPVSPGNYKEKKEDRFLNWLVSGSTPGSTPGDDTVPVTTQSANSVTLVGSKSVGDGVERENLQIHLAPTLVTGAGKAGGFAWWIGGENQKARLPKPYTPNNETAGRWAAQAKSHAVADPEPFRLEPLLADPAPADKAITLGQADLIEEKVEEADLAVSREFFHDLSAVSTGLLTNTATGGWRKDLSLLTESWEAQPKSGLPLFRITPTSESQASIPTPDNPVPAGSILYPWAAYRNSGHPILQHGPVTSWENLINYATIYKRISATPSGRISTALNAENILSAGKNFEFHHRVRILPVIARMHWVLSHSAAPSTTVRHAYEPRLLLTPVITMWNPYSMEITSSSQINVSVYRPLPVALKYTINGSANEDYHALTSRDLLNNKPALSGVHKLSYQIQGAFTLKPGETRLFSPRPNDRKTPGNLLIVEPGYRNGGGHYFPVLDDTSTGDRLPLSLPGSATLKADATFNTRFNDYGGKGVGVYIDMHILGKWALAYRMTYDPEVADLIYPPLPDLAEVTLEQCVDNPLPFLSTIFGARMASHTHLAAKGFVQSSPFVNFTTMGNAVYIDIGRHYGGTGHPVNSPFDYSFIEHPPGGDSLLPNADEETNRGYIVTGFNKSDGLSRCVIAELPSRPLASLGELVHWDLRYENPVPPYAFKTRTPLPCCPPTRWSTLPMPASARTSNTTIPTVPTTSSSTTGSSRQSRRIPLISELRAAASRRPSPISSPARRRW